MISNKIRQLFEPELAGFGTNSDMQNWLRTDEYGEVKQSLLACVDFTEKVPENITYWKWLIFAIHNALQGCMVIALTRSDGFGAINEEDEAAWLKAHETDKYYPTQERLLSFLELYKKIKRPGLIQYSTAPFKPTGSQGRSIKKLNSVRNDFTHFTPKGWSMDVTGLSHICIDCLNICQFLISSSGRFAIFVDYKEGELDSIIRELISLLRKLEIVNNAPE